MNLQNFATSEPQLLSRTSFLSADRLSLEGSVMTDDFDAALIKFLRNGDASRPALLDMTNVSYVDIAALSNMIATLSQRCDLGCTTHLAYPAEKSVRDFLATWRFPDALTRATLRPFEEILLPEDCHYMAEDQTTYSGTGDGLSKLEFDADWHPTSLTRRNFFEFLSFADGDSKISPTQHSSIPREEGRSWARPLVSQILKKHLKGEKSRSDIARVIIYESLSNAVRHPKANLIQVVSRFSRSAKSKDKKTLRICVWDNGESIIKTLRNALDNEAGIRSFILPQYMGERIRVDISKWGGKSKTYHISQTEEIPSDATDARLLVASLFPGVTSTRLSEVPPVDPFDGLSSTCSTGEEVGLKLEKAPGMGLYALMRTALDQFQGSLFIRSGMHNLKIRVAHDAYRVVDSVRYKCKITEYPPEVPTFKGNLLVIKLPLREIP